MGFFRRSVKVSSEAVAPAAPKRRLFPTWRSKPRRIADEKAAAAPSGAQPIASASAAAGAPSQEATIVLLGCDNAGKTSLAAALAGEKIWAKGTPPPTNGFNKYNASYAGAAVKLFDVGGGKNIRGIWDNYYPDAHGAVFVVDAAAPERFEEAATLLREAWSNARLKGKPLLVLANKQDRPQACSGAELAEALRVHELDGGADCQVGSGFLADGPHVASASDLSNSLDWLIRRVQSEYASLSQRVEKEMAEQKEVDRQAKEARKQRLAAKRAAREAKEKEEAEAAAAAADGATGEVAAPTAGVSVGLPEARAAPTAPADASVAAAS